MGIVVGSEFVGCFLAADEMYCVGYWDFYSEMSNHPNNHSTNIDDLDDFFTWCKIQMNERDATVPQAEI